MEPTIPPAGSHPPPRRDRKRAALIAGGTLLGLSAFALVMDTFGPTLTGESANRPLLLDGESFSQNLPHANHGAYENGDPGANAVAPTNPNGGIDVPTGKGPSPLFGAGDFQQRMLVFEEFGTQRFDPNAPQAPSSFPRPTTGPAPEQDPNSISASVPNPAALDAFLAEKGLHHPATLMANDTDMNPWEDDVEAFLGRQLDTPPEDGRPPGAAWAHQRWNEMYPQVYFKSAMAGAHTNSGWRDALQRHGYAQGEFGPGGLYHTVYDTDLDGGPVIEGTTAGIPFAFHPNFPVQDHKAMWTFDGTVPPKLLQARYGEGVLFRHYNALPIDPAANFGFGLHTISTHEHNGHNPAESDGFANAFYFPGQYWDYRWPMQPAGYDTINTSATDSRAGYPCSPGETLFVNDSASGSLRTCDASGRINIRGDYREMAGTHWFHDHMLDFTSQNVYKGNAAMMNYYSAMDRGNEAHIDGVNLRLPSGSALPWGNRDYDVNLVIADKAWQDDGQLWFNIFSTDGFVGDRMLTNFVYKPYFEVRARKYRFRLLVGAVARYMKFAIVKEVQGASGELAGPPGSNVSYDRIGFHMIANDGNLLEHALPFDGSMDLDGDGNLDEHRGTLPVQAIAERYDIIIDFAQAGIEPGDRLYMVNLVEHQNGRRPNREITLAEVLNGSYAPFEANTRWEGGDPAVGKFLQFRVREYTGVDQSMDPKQYEPGKLKMTQLPIDRNDAALLAKARHRTYDFGRSGGTDEAPWTVKTDGGPGLAADPRRISAAPQLATGPTQAGFNGANAGGYDSIGTLEIWKMTTGGGWAHPIHIHFEEGVILSRDGVAPPMWELYGRKDIYRIGNELNSSRELEVALHFREFAGTYVEHCHNTMHEDHAMLIRWDLEHPGQLTLLASPIPTWDGVEYVDSHGLPTFRTGDGTGPQANPNGPRLPQEIDVAFQIPGNLQVADITLGGVAEVKLQSKAVATGLLASGGTAIIDEKAKAPDIEAYGRVTIRKDAVAGNITTADTKITVLEKATTGTQLTGQNFGPMQTVELRFIEQPLVSQGAKTVLKKSIVTLAPDRYDSITVNSGGTVVLTTGTYFVGSFTAKSGSFVRYDDSAGPVTLVVSTALIPKGAWSACKGAACNSNSTTNGAVTFGTGATGNLLIAYAGLEEAVFDTAYNGFVVASNATVKLGGNKATHKGAFFAPTVIVKEGNNVNAAQFNPTVFAPLPVGALDPGTLPVADTAEYVKDDQALVALGKALFWDTQIGVDGQACASCHFSAGSDTRVKNQINPGILDTSMAVAFDQLENGGGANYTLAPTDFPLRRLFDFTDRTSPAVDAGNDVISSMGTFRGDISYDPGNGEEICVGVEDELYNVAGVNSRRVEPRNAPTVINAAFNVRNFWDGRANNHFNGMNPFGARDGELRIFRAANGTLEPVLVDVADSSLASQAVGPPLSHLEMNCGLGNARFDLLGRRVIDARALAWQDVHASDSVLGGYADLANGGLTVTYRDLIAAAFNDAYWNSDLITSEGTTLIENNFSLFFGLAVQAYEATLISDQTPFDEFANGDTASLTIEEKRGFELFTGKAGCFACHMGPTFTSAVFPAILPAERAGALERMPAGTGTAVYDSGFYNIGVTPTVEDIGLGNSDPWNNPLSFTRQEKDRQAGITPPDSFVFNPAFFLTQPNVAISATDRDAVDGSFKTPTLRNVTLTGPYFHNGGQATLEQVMQFYNRGGDRLDTPPVGCTTGDNTGHGENCSNLDFGIVPLNLTDQEVADIIAFMGTLTDDRVLTETAPFDHPSLPLVVGHAGDEASSIPDEFGTCTDEIVVLPAVGAAGRDAQGLPSLPTFEDVLLCVNGDSTRSIPCFQELYGAL